MPVSPAEKGLTVSDLKNRIAGAGRARAKHEMLVAGRKDLLGPNYYQGDRTGVSHASADTRISAELGTQLKVLSTVVQQAETLEGNLDRQLIIPVIPKTLFVPTRYKENPDPKLSPVLIPDMSDLTPENIRAIANGKPSPYLSFMPRSYFQAVAEGALPIPTRGTYFALVDRSVNRDNPNTTLSTAVGIPNLSHAPIQAVRRQTRKQAVHIRRLFGLPDNSAVRPVSAREAAVIKLFENEKGEIITNSQVIGEPYFAAFNGTDVIPRDGRRNGIPTRLAVSTRPLAIDVYLNVKSLTKQTRS